MKFSVYTLSLPDLAPEQGAALIARHGYQGVEWRLSDDPDAFIGEPFSFNRNNACTVGMTPADGHQLAQIDDRFGLRCVGVAPYIRVGDVANFERAAVVAQAAGAPAVRVRAPEVDGRAFTELFQFARGFLQAIAEVARRYEIAVALEIHQRTLCSSASLATRLVDGFDPRVIRVIYDVGNLVVEGYEDHRIGLDLLDEHISHIHLKNAWWERDAHRAGAWVSRWSPLDDGVLNAREFLELLGARGYAGWVSLEDLSTDRAPADTLAHNAELLRTWGFLDA